MRFFMTRAKRVKSRLMSCKKIAGTENDCLLRSAAAGIQTNGLTIVAANLSVAQVCGLREN